MDLRGAAAAAEKVVEAIDRVDGPILAGVGMFVPGAAPITTMLNHFLPLIIPDLEKALTQIAEGNNGDLFDTLFEFVNHIRAGKANSPVLSGEATEAS